MAAPAHITQGIDLGLSVLCAVAEKGDTLSSNQIAEVCDCSVQVICNITNKALKKLRKKIPGEASDYI